MLQIPDGLDGQIPIEEDVFHPAETVESDGTAVRQNISIRYLTHPKSFYTFQLYSALPLCEHTIVAQMSGGIKCTKCGGWFCY